MVTPGPPPAGVAVARSSHVVTAGVVETVTHLATAVAVGARGALWGQRRMITVSHVEEDPSSR